MQYSIPILLIIATFCASSAGDPCVQNMRYQLYTAANPATAQYIVAGNVTASNFNSHDKTVFLIHGWIANENVYAIKDAYLKCRSMNVIVVEWMDCAWNKLLSWVADSGTELIGDHIIQLVTDMEANGLLDLNASTFVGHSAGAHIASVVGLKLRTVDQTSSRVGQIVGLEPALAEYAGHPYRLRPASAQYVETMTTSGWGIREPLGHAAFYPNYGLTQPGCSVVTLCSHSRAIMLFAETINKVVTAVRCDLGTINYYGLFRKCQEANVYPKRIMGGEPLQRQGAQGTFYISTGSSSPYFPGTDIC